MMSVRHRSSCVYRLQPRAVDSTLSRAERTPERAGSVQRVGVHIGLDLGGTNVKCAVRRLARCAVLAADDPAERRRRRPGRRAGAGRGARAGDRRAVRRDRLGGVALPGHFDGDGARRAAPEPPGRLGRAADRRPGGRAARCRRCGRSTTCGRSRWPSCGWAPAAGRRDLVCIALGTGVGGGVVIGGRVHLGLGHAGEIGHTTVDPDGPLCGCGNRGCLDRMASAESIAAAGGPRDGRRGGRSRPRGRPARPSPRSRRRASTSAASLAGAVVLLWPERVVVGGGVAACRRAAARADPRGDPAARVRRAGRRDRRRGGGAGPAARAPSAPRCGAPRRPWSCREARRRRGAGRRRAGAGRRGDRRRARGGGRRSAAAARALAVPGFVDVQVNGFAGVDFLTAEPEDYARAGRRWPPTGVTAYQPTLHHRVPRASCAARWRRSPQARRRGGSARTSRARSCHRPGRARTRRSTCWNPTSRCVDELRADRAGRDDDGRARAAGRARARRGAGRARHRRPHRPHRRRRRDRPRGVRPRRRGR